MSNLINREDAIKAVSISCVTCLAECAEDCEKCSVPKLREVINNIPSTERTGEWIKRYLDELCLIATYTCSECGGMELSEFKYCPNCGAKMDGK